VTHFLINNARYRSNFRSKAGSFQPLTDYVRGELRGTSLDDLVLARPPKSAVVFDYKKWRVVSVAKLEQTWKR
jgi:hypothetical protein